MIVNQLSRRILAFACACLPGGFIAAKIACGVAVHNALIAAELQRRRAAEAQPP